MESFIHIRSSLNLLYAALSIVTFVLVFLGYNVQKNVREEVRDQLVKDIKELAQTNIDTLKMKVGAINASYMESERLVRVLAPVVQQIKNYAEAWKQSPWKLYVVYHHPVNGTEKIYYHNLTTVDGQKLPNFVVPPVMHGMATQDPKTDGDWIDVNIVQKEDYFQVYQGDIQNQVAYVTFWIYGK